jgi:multiple sugar transport system ATP-binding protein
MGHRVAVLKDGELQQVDAPGTLYHRPATVFVAGFIGSPAMNMLPVSLNHGVQVAGAQIELGPVPGEGERAVFGFRPETVVIDDNGPIAARIRLVEDLGSEVFVHLVIDHDGEERRIVAKVEPPFNGKPDENVRLALRGAVHLFDATEARRTTIKL